MRKIIYRRKTTQLPKLSWISFPRNSSGGQYNAFEKFKSYISDFSIFRILYFCDSKIWKWLNKFSFTPKSFSWESLHSLKEQDSKSYIVSCYWIHKNTQKLLNQNPFTSYTKVGMFIFFRSPAMKDWYNYWFNNALQHFNRKNSFRKETLWSLGAYNKGLRQMDVSLHPFIRRATSGT